MRTDGSPIDEVRGAESAWQRFAPVEWAGIAAVLNSYLVQTRGPGATARGVAPTLLPG